MLKNFKAYQLSLQFYRETQKLVFPYHLKEQLNRAASSICLNLSEGSGRISRKDQRRFYIIAQGSLRECQCILELGSDIPVQTIETSDQLGAFVFKLIKSSLKGFASVTGMIFMQYIHNSCGPLLLYIG